LAILLLYLRERNLKKSVQNSIKNELNDSYYSPFIIRVDQIEENMMDRAHSM